MIDLQSGRKEMTPKSGESNNGWTTESNNTITMCEEEAMGINPRENDVISALIA